MPTAQRFVCDFSPYVTCDADVLIWSGELAIHVAQLRMRCVMTTFDPDTLQQDLRVLRKIVKEANGKLALDCAVAVPGVLREGDPITVS